MDTLGLIDNKASQAAVIDWFSSCLHKVTYVDRGCTEAHLVQC